MIDEKSEPSVWRIALVAITVFVGIMALSGMFGSVEAVTIASK